MTISDSGLQRLRFPLQRLPIALLVFSVLIWIPCKFESAASAKKAVRHPIDPTPLCQKIVLAGEVRQGQQWKATLGEGWVFRVLPIGFGNAGIEQRYSGWDLALDRNDSRAGYPDGLLLASPPYSSLNEREIGVTYGLRSQDAIGWQPRHFRFLTRASDLTEARKLFQAITSNPGVTANTTAAAARLLVISAAASPGEFTILDARLTPGLRDPAPYAQHWAENLSNVPHTIVQAGQTRGQNRAPAGEIRWIRFAATLWLPKTLSIASDLKPELTKCPQ